MNLQGKTIVLGITGGIAAYKMPNVAHTLAKAGADVHVLMTRNATEFITPLVFETLTNNRCIVDTFDRNFQYDVAHVSLANAADLILVAPATANVIAKMAHGIADDMLTTVTLAATCPKLVARHEHPYAGEPHHTGQSAYAGALRLYGHSVRFGCSGLR